MDRNARSLPLAGRYRLVEQLGSGGMGVVWRAVDELLDREVAVKEVRAPQHMGEEDVRQLYARLLREARAAARISHTHVITVHDVVEQRDCPWIVMELVRGRSLAQVLEQEGTLQPEEAASVGVMMLRALRCAHDAGVLHRDVKPENVLLETGGRVVLTDFGIATIEGSNALTRSGEIVGSPEFLAPERAIGRRPGAPSDLWSLGATLYAAVEGVSPFRRATVFSTLQAVVYDELPQPRQAGPLGPLLEGLLGKDPVARMGADTAQRLLDAIADGGQVAEASGADDRAAQTGYVPTAAASPSSGPVFASPSCRVDAPLWERRTQSGAFARAGSATGSRRSAAEDSRTASGRTVRGAQRDSPARAAPVARAAGPSTAARPAGAKRPEPKGGKALRWLTPLLVLLLAGGVVAAGAIAARVAEGGQVPDPGPSRSAVPTSAPDARDDPDSAGPSEESPSSSTDQSDTTAVQSPGSCGGWTTECE